MKVILIIIPIIIFICIIFILILSNKSLYDNVAIVLHEQSRDITDSVQEMIKYYGISNDKTKNIKYYYTDKTSSSTLNTIKEIYNSGIRKIAGVITSKELSGDVETYLEDHPDLILVNGSATSPSLKNIRNIIYFIPNDIYMTKILAGLINLRMSNVKEILILYRNDVWGIDYENNLKTTLNSYISSADISSYSYDSNLEDEYFVTPISNMKQKLLTCSNPCIVYVGFDEITDYLNYINNDDTFKVKHFGTDGVALERNCLNYSDLLNEINFECVFYNGEIWSQKKNDLISGLNEYHDSNNDTPLYPSTYMYTYHDAIKCILKCESLTDLYSNIRDFHGLTGNTYIRDNYNRRELGSCHAVSILDENNWYTTAICNSAMKYSLSDDVSVEDIKIIDCDQTYKLSFDPEFDEYPVTIKIIDLYGKITKYTVTEYSENAIFTCPIASYVYVIYGNSSHIISNTLSVDSMHSIHGVIGERSIPTNSSIVESGMPLLINKIHGVVGERSIPTNSSIVGSGMPLLINKIGIIINNDDQW